MLSLQAEQRAKAGVEAQLKATTGDRSEAEKAAAAAAKAIEAVLKQTQAEMAET